MIIIPETYEKNLIFIYKNIEYDAPAYTLVLHSRSTNVKTTFEVEDTNEFSQYFTFEVDFRNMANGEYEYELKDCDYRIAAGMLKIGKNTHKKSVTYTSDINFQIYDPTK